MNFYEAIIIYLSLGAPVGVYNFQYSKKPRTFKGLFGASLEFLFWPFVLMQIIISSPGISKISFAKHSDMKSPTDDIIQSVFEIARQDLIRSGKTTAVAEFRELLGRYTGLFTASSAETNNFGSVEFFEASGHPNTRIAAACIRRRNREKLSSHRDAAAEEFRRFLTGMPIAEVELNANAAELAALIGDTYTTRILDVNHSTIKSPAFADGASVEDHSPQGKKRAA